jgi:hypothetical protein
MNNITPKQKEYIEIDEDFKCYTGRSKRLIPLVKHFKFEYLESLTDELSSFSFLKLNFGIYTLNYIKKIEENLPIFNEIIENDIKDRGYPKEKIETIKRVQSDLIIEINNAKSKAEKTSNKSSIKDKPKKSGRKAAEIKKLSEYIEKKGWNPELKNLFIEELKAEFKQDIISELENKAYPTIKVLIFELIRTYTKDPKNKQISKIAICQSVWNEFVNDDKISDSFKSNTNDYLNKPERQILSSSEYKKLEKRIKKIFKTRPEYFA